MSGEDAAAHPHCVTGGGRPPAGFYTQEREGELYLTYEPLTAHHVCCGPNAMFIGRYLFEATPSFSPSALPALAAETP